jgi:hypothetical protein
MTPEALEEPTATQSVTDGHETPTSNLTPDGREWLVHVVPASVVTRMSPPTAMQNDAEAQEAASGVGDGG